MNKPKPPPKRKKPNFAKADWPAIKAFLLAADFSAPRVPYSSPTDYIDALVSVFQSKCDKAIDSHVPSTTTGGNKKPWYSPDCYISTKATTKAYRKFCRNKKHKQNLADYKTKLAHTQATIQKAKQIHIARISDKLIAAASSKIWWSTFNNDIENSNYKEEIPGLKSADGACYTTDSQKATALNDYFAAQFVHKPEAKQTATAALHSISQPLADPAIPQPQNNILSKIRIRQRKLKYQLEHLDPSKATGIDQLPAIFLKNLAEILSKPLIRIFRLSLKHSHFPSSWKKANVIALHKKKSKSSPSNYRPISLLAIISKVFEALVCIPLTRFLGPLLNPRQFGFRTGHTSLDLLTNMSQRWINTLKAGGEVRAVALDISKAFDKVWHEGLLFKLKRFGVRGPLLAWIESFLTDRAQRVGVGTAFSPFLPVPAGVPQGSVLAPLLFLVFIDDLFAEISNELDVFADDSTLWAPIKSDSDRVTVAASLNSDLLAIEAWAKRWLVTYNHTKTELLTFSKQQDVTAFRRNGTYKDDQGRTCIRTETYTDKKHIQHTCLPNPHPPLNFCSSPIPEGVTFKVVGLTFSYTLSWNSHINAICKKANSALSLLYRARPYLSRTALAKIYKSHIRSRMEYCSPIWTGSPETVLRKLDKVQKRAERILGKSEAIKLELLAHRRGVSGLCFMHRIINKTAPIAVHDLCQSLAAPPTRSTRFNNKTSNYLTPFTIKRTDPNYWTRSCIPLFTDIYNSLPHSVQATPKLQPFKELANKQDFPTLWTIQVN